MRYLTSIMCGLCLCGLLLDGPQSAVAYHSYVLSVQQLRAGLMKASSTSAKGFVLVDVRSPDEHASGMIPGTDLNIDFREMKTRHRELGRSWTIISSSTANPVIAATLPPRLWPISATRMSTMWWGA